MLDTTVPYISMRVRAKLEVAQSNLCRARVVNCRRYQLTIVQFLGCKSIQELFVGQRRILNSRFQEISITYMCKAQCRCCTTVNIKTHVGIIPGRSARFESTQSNLPQPSSPSSGESVHCKLGGISRFRREGLNHSKNL